MSKRREANSRLYDAVLGRFLSPDPYVQMPDFSQNFNRYSYCLNNPLVYVDEDGEFFLTIICALVPGLQEFIPVATYIDAALWGGASNVVSNWKDIKVDGEMNWDKFWSYAGLGAANGAGIASGNIWIIGATSAVQGAGNKFTEQDFKFDSDQIWKEGLYFGLTSMATSYLLLPSNKPLGTEGFGLGNKINEGLNKIGLDGSASKYLGNGLANFSSSFITNTGYYKFITDNLDWRNDWLNQSLRMSSINTLMQFGMDYSYDKAMDLGIQKSLGYSQRDMNFDYSVNQYYINPMRNLPSNHFRLIPQTPSPGLSPAFPKNIFELPVKK